MRRGRSGKYCQDGTCHWPRCRVGRGSVDLCGSRELKHRTTAFILRLIELCGGPKRFFYWHLSYGCFNWLVPSVSTHCQPGTEAAEVAFVPCPDWGLSGCQFIILVLFSFCASERATHKPERWFVTGVTGVAAACAEWCILEPRRRARSRLCQN